MVPRGTRTFIDAWLDRAAIGREVSGLADNEAARRLVRDRERDLKGTARARQWNPTALRLWTGASGTGHLNYRWHRVRTITADILRGLEGGVHA